jgi:hypothetical protein
MCTPSTDAFWVVRQGVLYKTTFTYSNGLPNGVLSTTSYILSDPDVSGSDIAINVSASYFTSGC